MLLITNSRLHNSSKLKAYLLCIIPCHTITKYQAYPMHNSRAGLSWPHPIPGGPVGLAVVSSLNLTAGRYTLGLVLDICFILCHMCNFP